MKNHCLKQAYLKAGINSYFYNEKGIRCYASEIVKRKLLASFQQNTPKYWSASLLPTVKIFTQNRPAYLRLTNKTGQKYHGQWQLTLEQGQIFNGKVKRNCIQLPQNLPIGYHQLSLKCQNQHHQTQIIIVPPRCYQPQEIERKQHLWGSCLQLYTLKSEQNWGIGDFNDLQHFIQHFQNVGGDFIGLNPIHSLFPANPEAASPYSPSSRKWLNIIYISVATLPEFQQSQNAQTWFHSADIQEKLHHLRKQKWIDYSQVMSLKLTGLKLAFTQFCSQPDPLRQQQYQQFILQGGESLLAQATFDALHAELSENFAEQWGWNDWEAKYHTYHADAVKQFQQQNSESIEFYRWLQWCAYQQLTDCYQLCQQLKMPIGLYRDLAVGVAPNGAETWLDPELFCLTASIGAPPDLLAPQGQNWGLAPINPHILTQRAYQPFIEMLRANMQNCGALRIDHIMSLLRLWWLNANDSAKNGAYIGYPVDDLIAIIALESHRHQCLIIGEDLGTVPKAIISKLKNAGIFSYKVFYFEFDHQGESKALKDYPYQAMTTLSTHDLPTIDGYWKGYDFELGERYGIYPNPTILAQLKQDRINAKEKILAKLTQNAIPLPSEVNIQLNTDSPLIFKHQLQLYVSAVTSALFGLQPEDWLGIREPVNIPGTSNEYPNWRRRLTANLDEIFLNPEIHNFLTQINHIRKNLT
ncbi:4-alpha-glucanotransferase [Mergibacter septicus]|uniref:4-alpha-glucanotransferase n=1 Tax=Mergibacter septicus TaxID=221402 RepID=UPI001178F923|nr:4-alpha-glucanotransferase [Mergibacter septicus]AWX13766.1 4-alpha-glucanotransferase [Mergibacter septicus]